jgi:hypothetical protein
VKKAVAPPPVARTAKAPSSEPGLDPLKRVWIPIEKNGRFQAHDGRVYQRDPRTHVIRRATPKVRGKAARRADTLARRREFAAISQKSNTAHRSPAPSMGGAR